MESIDKFLLFIEQNNWIFAKTYADFAPHEYLVLEKLSNDNQKIFFDFVVFIRENGYKEIFMGKEYTCYNIGEYKYWTMGNPLSNTNILNRCFVDEKKRFFN